MEEGAHKFVPENWAKTYFEWMRNIQPWCVSRQLWWGHQIPAWYGPDGDIFVEMRRRTSGSSRGEVPHYGKPVGLDPRRGRARHLVLLGAVAFSTLGWPEETPELARYYPTDVLVTGFDIIFFWVARMMMMGLHFMGEVPFHTVYVHALVRDERRSEDVKVKRQRHRPARVDREVRRGCASLYPGLAGGAGPRRAPVRKPRRGQPQLRDQDLECGSVLPDERLRTARRV